VKTLDWIVLFGWLAFIVSYGIWRGRGSNTVSSYLLANKSMPWYAMGLSIMATQAGAISFISTTGQAYTDGMRFAQFYFGLPVAMVVISVTAAPIFHRAGVFTAYEYLEQRFDVRTRTLVSIIFLIQRGLAAGVALYATAVVLSTILGWSDRVTTLLMGSLMILYTASGGIKAVTWADVQQMKLLFAALFLALVMAIWLLPAGVSFADALGVAGAAGRLNPVTTHFDWNDRYNLWSGLIGGMFLALAYFGTDQSQVQRYLTGKSIAESRLSLMFIAITKVPMQIFILFIGAMVFVVFTFTEPPMLFQPAALKRIEKSPRFAGLEHRFHDAFRKRREAAQMMTAARFDKPSADRYRRAVSEFENVRNNAISLAADATDTPGFNDTNYVFLSFVTGYLPAGLVGLVVAVIFSAGMSSISGEINSLATVSMIDLWKRHLQKKAPEESYVRVSRIATVFWGLYAIIFASRGPSFGALIETVNMVGSFFYGSMLGVFVLAFGFPRVGARGAFCGVIAGELAIIATSWFTDVSYLWYNVVGCLVVLIVGVAVSPWKRPSVKPAGPQIR
jgi:SSS family solute:Na+ symporter